MNNFIPFLFFLRSRTFFFFSKTNKKIFMEKLNYSLDLNYQTEYLLYLHLIHIYIYNKMIIFFFLSFNDIYWNLKKKTIPTENRDCKSNLSTFWIKTLWEVYIANYIYFRKIHTFNTSTQQKNLQQQQKRKDIKLTKKKKKKFPCHANFSRVEKGGKSVQVTSYTTQ